MKKHKFLLIDYYEDQFGERVGSFETLSELKEAMKQYIKDTDGECYLFTYRWNCNKNCYDRFEI